MNSIEAVPVTAPALGRRGRTGDGDPASIAAVLAHTLLNSIAVVRGGTELLARHHETLPAAERHQWYRRVDEHAELLAAVLERMAQGRLADALALSDSGAPPSAARHAITTGRGRTAVRRA
jgi:hypothetical protein